MSGMRVYLGSDHAGFELKQQIIEHLEKTGHEPIDCGAFTYDAEDDSPAFCIAAATRTVADPESLVVDEFKRLVPMVLLKATTLAVETFIQNRPGWVLKAVPQFATIKSAVTV